MKEIKCPSGAILKISHTPFATSKALYQAVLEEIKDVKLQTNKEMGDIVKDIFCIGFSSKKIEAALNECMKRCTYNDGRGDLKIDDSTFEPVKNREDYSIVCVEIIQDNCLPFTKGLYAEFNRLLSMIPSIQV